ncbi:MAG: carbamoyltransferase C-terminal domain-containing protein, partial [Candidatus Omnitrophota bacterium]|nr:carbamoyltransferase C-terminal domain-containing protein [Candidatus Omnitrophota bacterium]
PPRRPESPLTQKDMDIARSIQDVTEEIMLKMADHVHRVTGKENLCLAGGVALNCVGNGRILRESKFKNIWIQPASGDAGGALGAAMLIWHQYLRNERRADNVHDRQKGSFLGPDCREEIESFANRAGAVCEKIDAARLPLRVAELVRDQNVVGILRGRMEFGPRALGSRSIIADARSEQMQSVLNLKTKFRESFRPFAPSVLEEKKGEYFDLETSSPYMMLVADVREDKRLSADGGKAEGLGKLKIKRSVIPAVTHVDNSARVQTVAGDVNPFFSAVLSEFDRLTGCPVMINTSFNVRGEPIVCSPEDAYRCFMCTNMDYLVMGDYLFDKKHQPDRDKYKLEEISRVLD